MKESNLRFQSQILTHYRYANFLSFVAVVGLAPLHDGYEPCMRLSHFYRDIKKATSFHNVSLLFYELTINKYT